MPSPAPRAARSLARLSQLYLAGLDPLGAFLPRTFVDLTDLHKVSGPPSPAPHILARLLPPSAWPQPTPEPRSARSAALAAPRSAAARAIAPGWPGRAKRPHVHRPVAPGDTRQHEAVPSSQLCSNCGGKIPCLRCFHWTDSVCRSALIAARASRIAKALQALD